MADEEATASERASQFARDGSANAIRQSRSGTTPSSGDQIHRRPLRAIHQATRALVDSLSPPPHCSGTARVLSIPAPAPHRRLASINRPMPTVAHLHQHLRRASQTLLAIFAACAKSRWFPLLINADQFLRPLDRFAHFGTPLQPSESLEPLQPEIDSSQQRAIVFSVYRQIHCCDNTTVAKYHTGFCFRLC
ncbi:hypothetical protein U1Q18_012825 [Sarracenia purpurea var. burkii]